MAYHLRGHAEEAAISIVEQATVTQLRQVVVHLGRRLRRRSEAGLTPSQSSALTTLARTGPLRPSELAERERIGRSTVTRLVRRLEELDCVERLEDPADGRSCRVVVSEQGHHLLEESDRRADAYLTRRLDELDDADRAAILAAVGPLERLLRT